MTHILLVHGAWHGAWCWYRTIPALAALGITAHTLDLPGHGLKAGKTQTLEIYAKAVAKKLAILPEPAMLLGHSMGGAVISAAAELAPERISSLVYLCAFLPKSGESIFSLAGEDSQSLIGGFMQPQPDGTLTIADEGLKPVFYADCGDDDIALARLMLVPQSPEPFQAAPTLTKDRFGNIRRTYILCENDKAIGIKKQKWLVKRSGVDKTVTLPTSHSPFFSAPAALAEAIKTLV